MKCRVCGYEYDDSKLFCPMCGTKAPENFVSTPDIEINWNTKEFPKPKKADEQENPTICRIVFKEKGPRAFEHTLDSFSLGHNSLVIIATRVMMI